MNYNSISVNGEAKFGGEKGFRAYKHDFFLPVFNFMKFGAIYTLGLCKIMLRKGEENRIGQ